MWEGRYESAARNLSALATKVDQLDPAHAAWYLHWVGVAFMHAGKIGDANAFFWQASNKKLSLGRLPNSPAKEPLTKGNVAPGPQANRVAKMLSADFRKSIASVLVALKGDGGKNADDHEANLKLLGEMLGFLGHRPDADTGKGPDVLWEFPEQRIAIAIEAKTQKESPRVYKKNKHIGKVLNDCNWLEENFNGYTRRLLLVGPLCGIAPQASPPPDLRVLPMSEFVELADRLSSAAQQTVARIDANSSAEVAVENAFSHYGLIWPECLDALDYRLAGDLQSEVDPDEVASGA